MILLLGASGQVGRELARSLVPVAPLTLATRDGKAADPFATGAAPGGAVGARARIDLADLDLLEGQLDALAPRIIVNAAAYTAVDRAEDEPELAAAINHRAVAILANWAARNGALLVHYSTDYVFAGDATAPYDEAAEPAPASAYGRSKWAGEQAIHASGCEYLILRTAWVYAAHGQNFLRTILRAAHAGRALRVVADQVGAPTSARLIADVTARLLRDRAPDADEASRETLHLTCSGVTSWHTYAQRTIDRSHALDLLDAAPRVEAIASADWPTRARRPAYSVLDCGRLATRIGTPLPHWQDELEATLLELTSGHSLLRDRTRG